MTRGVNIEKQLENSRLIGRAEPYSLYFDRETSIIFIYNDNNDEVYYTDLLKLGNAVFGQKEEEE